MKLHLQPTSEPLVSVTCFLNLQFCKVPHQRHGGVLPEEGAKWTLVKWTCWTYFEYPNLFYGIDIGFKLTSCCYAATICHLILCWRNTASYTPKAVCGSVSQRHTVIMTFHVYHLSMAWFRKLGFIIEDWDLAGAPCHMNTSKRGGVREGHSH